MATIKDESYLTMQTNLTLCILVNVLQSKHFIFIHEIFKFSLHFSCVRMLKIGPQNWQRQTHLSIVKIKILAKIYFAVGRLIQKQNVLERNRLTVGILKSRSTILEANQHLQQVVSE